MRTTAKRNTVIEAIDSINKVNPLKGADLRGANLENIEADYSTIGYFLACPETGSFVAYKKVSDKLITLLIPEDALRSSATTRKCRASKAKILDIEDKIPVCSNWDKSFIYEIGKTLEISNFDTDRWNECAPGIHFFITKDEALNY